MLTVMSLLPGSAALGRIAEQMVRLRSAAARMLYVLRLLFLCFRYAAHACKPVFCFLFFARDGVEGGSVY